MNLREKIARSIPLDLGRAVGQRELMRMVFEAVDAAGWPRPRPVLEGRTPEPVLRTLLTYCYATGVFSSEEIETLATRDANVRYLCANDTPSFEEIRLFRRHNVVWLRETLARALFAGWSALHGDQPQTSLLPFIAEADHRLASAIEADSAAMDY